jgi:transcriptional regulator with XRE-family HTH domain
MVRFAMTPQENFAAMIAGLEATGISRTEIARQCHVSRGTVWRLAQGIGKEPTWSTGRSIEQLFILRAVPPVKQKTL